MDCPNCQNPLVKSKVGHLCLVCGLLHKSGRKRPTVATSTPVSEAVGAPIVPVVADHPDSLSPTPPPHHRRWIWRMAIGAVALIVLAVVYLVPGWLAGRHFEHKLMAASSFQLHGQMVMQASSFLTILQSNLGFSGAVDKTKGQTELSYDGVFGSRRYSGQSLLAGGRLYTKLSGSDLPFIRYNQGAATYHLVSNQWYVTQTGDELYKYYCQTQPSTKYPSGLIWLEALNQVKLRYSPLILYAQSVGGHRTTHLRGSIDSASLAAAWAKVNAAQPQDCQIELVIDDLAKLGITYDLWTSPSFDQIKLHLNDKEIGLTGTVTIQLNGYNEPTDIVAPAGALNLTDLFAVRAAIQGRDYQRRADVDALGAALKTYYAANKTLPMGLAALAPKYIAALPHDPTSGQSYSYVQVKHKTFSVTTTLEDGGALYQATGP